MAKTNKYNLSFSTSTTKFVVSYANGIFKRLEYKGGGIYQIQWKHLDKVVPLEEQHIKQVVEHYEGRVIYDRQEAAATNRSFAEFRAVYWHFFESTNGVPPKFDGVEGNALKNIIAYITNITASPSEALAVWEQLLSNWNKLEEFYQKQTLLRQINSNLSQLLTQIKNGKGDSKSKAKRNADDLRESL